VWNLNNILEGPKNTISRGFRHAKTLTLDDYQVMLNTGPLGGEGVPLF